MTAGNDKTAWTTPAQLRERVQKDWAKGTLLTALWKGEGLPYRVALKGPTSAQWSQRFDEARRWIASWDGHPVEWREFTHPVLGRNRVPVAVVYSQWDELWRLIGQGPAARRFVDDARLIVEAFPDLEPWVADHPRTVVDHAGDWPRVLGALGWLVGHPRPGVYLRQIDAPGVHTKFVEDHRTLLAALLDLVVPGAADPAWSAAHFAERYGFLARPRLVRYRHLDPHHPGPHDVTWRQDDWARRSPEVERVFVTENEVNFLAFPAVPRALVVFGAGYGFDGWDQVPWLARVRVDYWGDLDTHGFAILDQLRSKVPGVHSLFMDQATLLAHRPVWGREPQPTDRVLTRLTDDEQDVYQGLVTHRWAPQLRLEQERVAYSWVERGLV